MACREEMLQWGRSRLAPENAAGRGHPQRSGVASMGPEPVSSGKRNRGWNAGSGEPASMGPEPVSSGKPRAATCHPLGA